MLLVLTPFKKQFTGIIIHGTSKYVMGPSISLATPPDVC
jgi:hypothetical protein